MSSPIPNQRWQGWTIPQYQQPSAQYQDLRMSQVSSQNHTYYGPYSQVQAPYVQSHNEHMSSAPIIAELPAPLPPAPPTTTSEEQLKEDGLLAQKLQQLEVDDVGRRSSSDASQHQQHPGIASPSPPPAASLLHHPSSQSLRAHSQSVSSTTTLHNPGSLGPPPHQSSPSLLPEVVVGPRPATYYLQSSSDNLPIPIIEDQNATQPPPSAPLDPASMSAYLEQHRRVPYPPQWTLPPVLATFYAYQEGKIASGASWLDTLESLTWRTVRPVEHAHNPTPPSYSFKFKSSSGSFRSPKHSWVMTCPEEMADASKKLSKSRQPKWAYDLKIDSSTGMRKTESMSDGQAHAILTTYVHGLNYDSLRFIDPDGRACMWVSSAQLSSINGSRYDTVRHALFVATGNIPDPLYGEIVADHTFWDGYVDEAEVHIGIQCEACQTKPINGLRWKCRTCPHHDVCNACRMLALSGQYGGSIQPTCDFSLVSLPDEAVYIRSPTVDPALVVATLQVLKDWEKHSLRQEKKKNSKAFLANEVAARKCDLGIMSYWKGRDWDKKGAESEKFGTRIKARAVAHAAEATAAALENMVDAKFTLRGVVGSHSGGSGGLGGGGSGGGGS